jgi:hypothetical protein
MYTFISGVQNIGAKCHGWRERAGIASDNDIFPFIADRPLTFSARQLFSSALLVGERQKLEGR